MTIRLMALPLLCVVGVATAAGGEKEAIGAQGEPDAAQEQVREQATVGKVKRPGTAMDFALALVELLVGKATRDQVETGLVRP